MPNTRHRKKTLRKSEEANARNRAQRSAMRTAVKKAREAEVGDTAIVREAEKRLDKAARKNLIHPNKAARMKSRLAKARNRAANA